MKFFLDNWPLVFAALASGAMLLWPTLRGGGSGGSRIAAAEAVRLINREKAVLIDVGEPDEFAAGHAAGARNVPVGALDGHKGLPSNKALPLVLLCASGVRASRAAGLLRKAGYEKAFVLAGGTAAWRDASLPIERSEKPEKVGKSEKNDKGEKSA